MRFELAQIAASGWPLVASLAAAATAGGLREGRRRTALNEALHELRRPLQVLALTRAPAPGGAEGSLQMAAAALERLDREINGGPAAPVRAPIRARALVESVAARWRDRVALAGATLRVEWAAGEAALAGDRRELAAALDNLVANAIEHGGPEIAIEASAGGGVLTVAVVDSGGDGSGRGEAFEGQVSGEGEGSSGGIFGDEASGGATAGDARRARPGPAKALARLSGRRRHGHGLRLVRRAAAAHGGHFHLSRPGSTTRAVLHLPASGRELHFPSYRREMQLSSKGDGA